jgi:hypothetical protein
MASRLASPAAVASGVKAKAARDRGMDISGEVNAQVYLPGPL